MFIISQILFALGYIIYYVSRFFKDKVKIVFVEAVSKIVSIIAYFFIGDMAGVGSNVITMTRSWLIMYKEKKQKKMIFAFVLILLACISVGILTYKNIFSTFCYISAVITTTSAWFCKPQKIRLWGIVASIFYLGFQISIFNITGAIFELGTFTSCVVSYFKYKKIESENSKE